MGVKSSDAGTIGGKAPSCLWAVSPVSVIEVPSETGHMVARRVPSEAPASTWIDCMAFKFAGTSGLRVVKARPNQTSQLRPSLVLWPGPCSPGGHLFSSVRGRTRAVGTWEQRFSDKDLRDVTGSLSSMGREA